MSIVCCILVQNQTSGVETETPELKPECRVNKAKFTETMTWHEDKDRHKG